MPGTRMLQRRGSAADWASANPILDEGEIGYAIDTHSMRIGDGINHWLDLPDFNGPQGLQGDPGPEGPAPVGDSDWTIVGDQYNWTSVVGYELAVRKDGMGFVHIKGSVKRVSGTSAIIADLPAGYEADHNLYEGVLAGDLTPYVLGIQDSVYIGNIPLPAIDTIVWINTSYYSGL